MFFCFQDAACQVCRFSFFVGIRESMGDELLILPLQAALKGAVQFFQVR